MLRPDEVSAWTRFIAATPRFAGEDIASWVDGPDPPDVLCITASGRAVGIELTKWVEHAQVTAGAGRERLENSYLNVIRSEKEPRPARIGRAFLHDKGQRLRHQDAAGFRAQLFAFIERENAKPSQNLNFRRSIPQGYWNTVRAWETPQGAPVHDFVEYPLLEQYLKDVWILPKQTRTSTGRNALGSVRNTGGNVYAGVDG
jgi:hypothetical protein